MATVDSSRASALGVANPRATFGDAVATHTPPLLTGRVCDLLADKLVVMTGVTGFIGEQILWKVLTELPRTRAGVLVRPKGSVSARERVVALVGKPIFKQLRQQAGGAESLVDQRILVIEGDLPHVPDLPRDIDVLIHSAGDVSFDPPIDEAFRTNVIGTQALLGKLIEACSDDTGELVPGAALRAHLHRVHRRTPTRRDPRGRARPRRRLRHRNRGRAGDEAAHRGAEPHQRAAGLAAQAGGTTAPPGRVPHHRRGHRAPAPGMGEAEARRGRHRTGPQPRLDRRLHLRQGDGRAGRGRRRPRHQGVDRAPGHRRVEPQGSLPRMDRGVQDGRSAHPRLRAGSAAGVPGQPRRGHRHRALRPRRQRDPGGGSHRTRGRQPRVLPLVVGRPEPADVPGHLRERARVLRTPPLRRGRRGGTPRRMEVPGRRARRADPRGRRGRRRRSANG